MGLGIYIKTEIPKVGILRKNISTEKLFKDIADEFTKIAPDQLLSKLITYTSNQDKMFLQLYPVEEPVEFTIEENYLICSAKTNSAGPGYHAFLVESLEFIEKSLKLKWSWTEDDGNGDETNYYLNRNFNELKLEMLKWLQSISKILIENQDYDQLMISMPLGYSLVENFFAISPLGFWTKDWFLEVSELDDNELESKGKEFFPWWERELDSLFYLKTALAVSWVELPWHTYNTEYEHLLYTFVLDCFKKVNNAELKLMIPNNIENNINSYLNSNLPAPPPEPSGVGFKKRLMNRSMTGSWTTSIPGYFYFEMEDDGKIYVYWFNDLTIRGSSFTVEGNDGKPVSPKDLLMKRPEHGEVIEYFEDHLEGWATIELNNEDENEFFILKGNMATINNLCSITICFENESDREWAISIWKSTKSSIQNDNDD